MSDPSVAVNMERPGYGYAGAHAGESSVSAVSWGAVLGGAFVAAALSLILLALGSGLGLSSISPWENAGASATTLGIASMVWLCVMQLIAAGTGGYLAGRLRTKWVGVHTDEVFFRDTAHGFLVWAVGLVVTAAFLTSAATSLVGGAVKTGASVVGGAGTLAAATGAAQSGMGSAGTVGATPLGDSSYYVDRMLRSDRAGATPGAAANPGTNGGPAANAAGASDAGDAGVRSEIGRALAVGLRNGQLDAGDRTYIAQVVASRTGMNQADAEKRVDDVVGQAKAAADRARAAADAARKAAAYASLWIFVSLLIGAFCASYAATLGGRARDR
jgi:hypothetical protein